MAKQYEIAFRLGAQMDSTFARSFTSASKEFRSLQDNIARLNKGRGTADTTRPVRNDLKKTQAEFRHTQAAANQMMNGIKKAGAVIGGVFAARKLMGAGNDIIQTFASFEQGMADVKAVSGAVGDDFARLEAKALEMGSRTSKTATEAAAGLKYISLAGWNTEQALAGIEPILRLSEAGTMDLGRASDLATDSMAAMGVEVNGLMSYLDKVAQTSRKANTSVEQLMDAFVISGGVFKTFNVPLEESNALLGILANRGYKGSEAGTAMNAIITNLTSGMGQAGTAMEELNLSAFDGKGKFKGLEKVFREVKAKLDPMTESQKAQYIAMIAGKEHLKTFTGVLDGLGLEYNDLKKNVQSADGALMQMAETQMDTYKGSVTLLKSAVEGAQIALGKKLAPTIRRSVDQLTDYVPKVMDKFEQEYAAMTQSPIWQNGDWLDKSKIAWDRLISKPFSAWWAATGKAEFDKIAGEVGKAARSAVGGVFKEALSFNGTTSMLAAGALAIPAVKVGKGATGSFKMLQELAGAGNKAGSGVSTATRAVGMLGPALGMLTNPIGLAVAGIAALGLGWVAYKKHQEKARQELLNMKGALDSAFSKYSTVDTQNKKTKELIKEYDGLTKTIKDAKAPAGELEEARRRLKGVEQELIALNPDILKAEDAKSARFREQVGLADRLNNTKTEMAKRELEKTTIDNKARLPELDKEYERLTGNLKAFDQAYVDAKNSYVQYNDYLNRKQAILQNTSDGEERVKQLRDLSKEIEKATGKHYNDNWATLEFDMLKFQDQYNASFDKWKQTQGDIEKADESFRAIYDAQKNLIEMNLGAKLEEQAKKFNSLSEEEKRRFNEALTAVAELNRQMNLLPTEKKMNVRILYEQSGQLPDKLPLTLDQSSLLQKPQPKPFPGMRAYADGGLANQPSIFGEAGLEAAIPIDSRPRSHAILDKVNRMMGHDNGGGGDISVTFSPQITIQGGGSDVQQQLTQALRMSQEEFERRFKEMMRQQRRLSYD